MRFKVNIGKIKDLTKKSDEGLEFSSIICPDRSSLDQIERLHQEVSRLYLRILFSTLIKLLKTQAVSSYFSIIENILETLQSLDQTTLLTRARQPEFTSVTWKLRDREIMKDYSSMNSDLAFLGNLFLDVSTNSLLISTSNSNTITLPNLGIQLRFSRDMPKLLSTTFEDGNIIFRSPKKDVIMPKHALNSNSFFSKDLRIIQLPGIAQMGFRSPLDETWYHQNYPKGGDSLASPIDFSIQPSLFSEFCSCVNSGRNLISKYWPKAFLELGQLVQSVLPLNLAENPFKPHNESVHAFRGLVSLAPRPSYLAGQTLVHEMTHNKFSSILDITPLFTNSQNETHYSPFVKAKRPLANLFHGIASFLADVHMSESLLGNVEEFPDARIEPYILRIIKNIDEANDIIKKEAKLTESGRAVCDGFNKFRESLKH